MRLVDRPPMLGYVLSYLLLSTPTVDPTPHRVSSIGGESTRRANVPKQHISNPGVGVGGGIKRRLGRKNETPFHEQIIIPDDFFPSGGAGQLTPSSKAKAGHHAALGNGAVETSRS